MKNVFTKLSITTLLALLFPVCSSMVVAPGYLRELNIEEKPISADESKKATSLLKNRSVIAIRSLKNGGYVFATMYGSNQVTKTLKRDGTASFLAYATTTPSETQFMVIRPKKGDFICLKSIFMEGKVLACDESLSSIRFKDFDANDESQQWIIKSGQDIKQVYFQNKKTKGYLTLEKSMEGEPAPENASHYTLGKMRPESCMECTTTEQTTRLELFKIVILDSIS